MTMQQTADCCYEFIDKPTQRSSIAPYLLVAMISIIAVGPRISVDFVDAEIRVQDILIGPTIIYLLLSRKPDARFPVRRLLGNVLPIFIWASLIVVALSSILFPEVSLLRRVTYYGRTIEMLVLAVVIAGLYLRCGRMALKLTLGAISASAMLNLIWFGFQIASGIRETLLGQEFSENVESYGPKLIGEPSAFGVGQYWAFVAAVSVARIKSGNHRLVSALLLASSFAGAWIAESRISAGSILVVIGIAVIVGKSKAQSINVLGALCGALIATLGFAQIIPNLEGRFSPDAVRSSFQFRMESIWGPLIDVVIQSPLIGIGPGGLLGKQHLSEAHNIVIRAMLDFGIFVGLLFISLFLRSMIQGFALARTENADESTRIVGYAGAFCVLSTLVSGLVQDALTPVMSTHLTMVAIGILAAQWVVWQDRCQLMTKINH